MRESIDNVNHQNRRGDDDVLELVHSVMHQFRALQYQRLRDGPHDITHMESKVLGFFAQHPGATQTELAEHSGRDKAQLARLIKRLLEIGLLEREADAEDRRQLRLQLTDAGHAVQRSLHQQRQRLAKAAIAGLSPAEHAQLKDLLQRLQSNLGQA
ncbi:MarR family winged helix-turn-helix transcriptional regulator [Aquabacterium sp.]|uniref:MarR family winged helix-turn-helix transcriptional regulator n=1 Tax=Aquabacterium sp. TaxID=1872578 RepID=UPI002BAE4E64|nr:MarR family transcriptional regulator [Aquabacterium sp.]HSW07486.1 MarR family transcriptional regulator [Aquabacterium sp.]